MARPRVVIALESNATSIAAVREDAVLAAQAGMDAVLLIATRGATPAALPFELADFDRPDQEAPALDALAEAATIVREHALLAAVAVAHAETLVALGGVDAIYVPSAALTDLPWLARLAETGAPLWVGTGMSTQDEVDEAVAALVSARSRLTLVHGLETGSARPDELNLRAIGTQRDRLLLPAGFRAAGAPAAASIASVACGATLVIVSRTDADTLATLAQALRYAAESLGDGVKRPQASEWPLRDRAQHSLVARTAIARGEVIGSGMLGTAPPGLGLKPRAIDAVVGRRAVTDIPAGTLLTLGMLE